MLYNIYSNIYFVSDCCGKVFRLILACLQHRRRVSKQICANVRNGKAGKEGGRQMALSQVNNRSVNRERARAKPSRAEFQPGHWRHIKGVISAAGGRKFDNSRGEEGEGGLDRNWQRGNGKRDDGRRPDGLTHAAVQRTWRRQRRRSLCCANFFIYFIFFSFS